MVTIDLSVYFYFLKVSEVLEGLKGLPPLFIGPTTPLGGRSGLLYPMLCVAALGGQRLSTISQAVYSQLWNLPSRNSYYPGHGGQLNEAP